MRKVLAEEWFPIDEISVESVRERSASSALPPLYFLHVWFARRPLTTAIGSILTSILVSVQRKEILEIMGIPAHKNLVEAQRMMLEAKANAQQLKENPFQWERAYKHIPSQSELTWLHRELVSVWGGKLPVILDPMAGGGSIPYEAIRLGLPTIAGDINPVAYIILKATTEYPALYGERLIPAVKEFCSKIHKMAQKEIAEFFPRENGEEIFAYLWARTVRCKSCNLIIPLSPNWWISRTGKNTDVAAKIVVPKAGQGDECTFEIITNPKRTKFDPDIGTDVGKEARCPRCLAITSGDEVKQTAQALEMGHQLFAVCTKRIIGARKRWHFRVPAAKEIEAIRKAELKLKLKSKQWEASNLMPTEDFPENHNDIRPLRYGMTKWRHMFNPRQLLTHLTYLEKFHACRSELLRTHDLGFASAVSVYAAMVFDTCINYNCILTRWAADRQATKAAMDMQAFPFKTSYAEFDHAEMLWPWAQNKTVDSLAELIRLIPAQSRIPSQVYHSDASSIPLANKSIEVIVVDPPYGNNVMYGEMSDFFYVWLKRLVGDLFPDSFRDELTNKIDEAVANSALYRDTGKSKEMANQHYYSKMLASFREINRVLKDDGVLTVMFTHREVEAWTGLAKALSDAGFTFKSSWPVLTEPGEKFGKSDKGVLKVTIILTCRKREVEKRGLWSHVQQELQEEAEARVVEYSKRGLQGMNLLVSVYGPVLGKFTDYTIVKGRYQNEVISPEQALDIVSEAVNRHNTAEVTGSDLLSLAYINLLKNFPSLTMDSDLARVTTVFGGRKNIKELDVKGGEGLVETRAGKVSILLSKDREATGHIDVNKHEKLTSMIDIVHVSLRLYEERGMNAVKQVLSSTGKDSADSGFISVLKAIRGIGKNDGAAKKLVEEANTASLLLEALGHQPEGIMKKGERMDHYLSGQLIFEKEGKVAGTKDLRSF